MTQTAALFLVASEYADSATTYGARQYYLGVRDAFEAVFRACHRVEESVDVYGEARRLIDHMADTDRVTLITVSRDTLRARRAETVTETWAAG